MHLILSPFSSFPQGIPSTLNSLTSLMISIDLTTFCEMWKNIFTRTTITITVTNTLNSVNDTNMEILFTSGSNDNRNQWLLFSNLKSILKPRSASFQNCKIARHFFVKIDKLNFS